MRLFILILILIIFFSNYERSLKYPKSTQIYSGIEFSYIFNLSQDNHKNLTIVRKMIKFFILL